MTDRQKLTAIGMWVAIRVGVVTTSILLAKAIFPFAMRFI